MEYSLQKKLRIVPSSLNMSGNEFLLKRQTMGSSVEQTQLCELPCTGPREDAGGLVKLGYCFNLGYCFTPYQRLRLYNGAPFSRLLRHAGDTEDVFST